MLEQDKQEENKLKQIRWYLKLTRKLRKLFYIKRIIVSIISAELLRLLLKLTSSKQHNNEIVITIEDTCAV